LELSDHGKSPLWQPRTATEADRLLSATKNLPPAKRQLIGVVAARRTAFEALAGACDVMGHDAVWLLPSLPPPVQHVDAMVCDATLDLTTELTSLESLREQLRSPPAILLLDFPRQGDLTQAMNAGLSAVLAKPYLISDLAAEIERISSASSGNRLVVAA
jgi:CheY-like chemotaxis protein